MSDDDRAFLQRVFDSLVVDEVKRMKIITEILRMPEDEAGIAKMLQSSADTLKKLNEVNVGVSEAEHYGGAPGGAPLPAQQQQQQGGSQQLIVPRPVPLSTAPSTLSAPASSANLVPSPASSPVPTFQDYQSADIAALAEEMRRRKEGALDELDDRVVTSDNANDFITVGGLDPLLETMRSRHDSLRWRAAQALSTIVQNNPTAQKKAFERAALDYLMSMLTPPQTSSSSSSSSSSTASRAADKWTVVVKALTALSALLRAEDLSIIRDTFLSQNGFQRLAVLMLLPDLTERAQVKLLNLFRLMFAWYPHTKQLARQAGLLPFFIRCIGKSDDILHRESAVKLLNEFAKPTGTKEEQEVAKELRKSDLGLKDILHARIKQLKAIKSKEESEAAEDELNLLTALWKTCKFSHSFFGL